MTIEPTYHIIQVFDYKGGDLYTQLNYSREEFIDALFELFGLYVFTEEEENLTSEKVKSLLPLKVVQEYIVSRRSSYPSDYLSTYELYECKNNILEPISVTPELVQEVIDCYANFFD